MTQEEIKIECEAQYLAIKIAHAKLAELRLLCKHTTTFNGNYSWRVGAVSEATICSDCGMVIQSIS